MHRLHITFRALPAFLLLPLLGCGDLDLGTRPREDRQEDRREDRPTVMTEPVAPPPRAAAQPDMRARQAEASFDQGFIDHMVRHHQGAVEMARIAAERAEHAELKEMAARVSTSQQAEIAKLREWRGAWYGSTTDDTRTVVAPMPSVPGASPIRDISKDIAALQTAEPFDLAYLDAMIRHHQTGVDMAQMAAGNAERAEIRELAADIERTQKEEIAQMQAWRNGWYPGAPAAMPTDADAAL